MSSIWILGMGLNISGSVMVNFGTNLMKSSHNLAARNLIKVAQRKNDGSISMEAYCEADILDSLACKRIWRFGMSIFIIGSLVNFSSFAFAAQSLLAALGTVQVILNLSNIYSIFYFYLFDLFIYFSSLLAMLSSRSLYCMKY